MRSNRKAVWLVILFLIAASVIYSFAGRENRNNIKEVTLYFFNRNATDIVATKMELSAENSQKLYEEMANALIKGPSDKGVFPIMDKNIELNYIRNDNGSLTVDFSDGYREAELMSTYAVVKSFTRLPEIKYVKVTAGGREIVKGDSDPLGFISGDEVNTELDDDYATGIRLYFANQEKTGLVMEYRKINITDTQPVEQYIVTELIKGPKNKSNEKLLAQDTGVLSVETTDGTCYVNFKQDFIDKNIASQDKGRLIIYSVVNSLTERDNISNVQFLIDGKKTDKFGEMDISQLFVRNEALIVG